MSSSLFEAELKLFELHRHEWLQTHPGTYVAIQGDVVVDGFLAPTRRRLGPVFRGSGSAGAS
jgi:hypothetical protein